MKISTATGSEVVDRSSLPDFLGIGAQKAATKWLYEMLQQHPGVWMPPLKELHFFNRIGSRDESMRVRHRQLARKHGRRMSDDARAEEWLRYLDRVTAPARISEEWYRSLFSWPAGKGVMKGEITPAYLEIDEERVRHARALLGSIRILVIVRRPLDRALSQLRMEAARVEDDDPAAWTAAQWLQFHKKVTARRMRGAYSSLPKWIDAFGADNVLAIPFADIRETPETLMNRIEDFLGIGHFGQYTKLEEQVHTSKKLSLPQEIIDRVADQVAGEDAFLKDHFGEQFFERTR